MVNLGQVVFNADDTEAIQQLKDFAGTKYSPFDDFPDVLAEAVNRIDGVENVGKITITKNWFR